MLSSKDKKNLQKIAAEIEKCSECKKGKSGKAVPGEGNLEAKIVFVGEAPGKEEAKTGRPFVGPSGKYLMNLLSTLGLKREEVYITSPVKFFPGRRPPTLKEIEHGRVHLLKQLAIIKPKIIVLLGKVAALAVLGQDFPVFKMHGQMVEKEGITYFFTFHPSAARRFFKARRLMGEDFRKLKDLIQKSF